MSELVEDIVRSYMKEYEGSFQVEGGEESMRRAIEGIVDSGPQYVIDTLEQLNEIATSIEDTYSFGPDNAATEREQEIHDRGYRGGLRDAIAIMANKFSGGLLK